MSIELVKDLHKVLEDHKANKVIRISSSMAREQKAERIKSVEFVEQLNAVVIFTERED